MEPTAADGVRALAAWLHARRELTERVEVLLMHGPTAVQRVTKHLEELRAYYARELAAFDAFATTRGLAADGLPVARDEPPADPGELAEVATGEARRQDYPPLRSVVLPP